MQPENNTTWTPCSNLVDGSFTSGTCKVTILGMYTIYQYIAIFTTAIQYNMPDKNIDIYHFDTSHQRKPQGYISNIPWEQVYIMIYLAAMVTSQ